MVIFLLCLSLSRPFLLTQCLYLCIIKSGPTNHTRNWWHMGSPMVIIVNSCITVSLSLHNQTMSYRSHQELVTHGKSNGHCRKTLHHKVFILAHEKGPNDWYQKLMTQSVVITPTVSLTARYLWRVSFARGSCMPHQRCMKQRELRDTSSQCRYHCTETVLQMTASIDW